MTTYIPARGDFAILTVTGLTANEARRAIYVVSSQTGAAYWVTATGMTIKHGDAQILSIRQVRVPETAKKTSNSDPLTELLDMFIKKAKPAPAKKPSGGIWSMVVDAVIAGVEDAVQQAEHAKTQLDEPTKPGAVVIDKDGREWMRTFGGRWQNASGMIREWSYIREIAVSVKD